MRIAQSGAVGLAFERELGDYIRRSPIAQGVYHLQRVPFPAALWVT
jgi:hypothetical protein